ncbi:MAG TPA: hypothetical protein VGR46_00040 [Candidatus Limnocylindria bacterium]|jgi:hypothetical protein|nr:hypothetical protein [Candidatus Limnocylindria bacterium]
MKRAILAVIAATVLSVGMTFPVSGIGLTQVTLDCSDGTSLTMTVDTDTLTSLTSSVQALLDYPAGLTCTLAQTPVVRFGNVADAGLIAGFVNGGGRFQGACPGGGTFWVNIAVNAQNQDGRVVGTVNQTVVDGQCVAPGFFKSTPTCLQIFSEDPSLAWVTTIVNETSGTFFTSQGVTAGSYARFSFRDNGSPSEQSGVFDRIGETPAGSDPACAGIGNTPTPFINLANGNLTVRQR